MNLVKILTTILQIFPLISSSDDIVEKFTAITTNYRAIDRVNEKYQLHGELREYCDVTSDCREFAYACNKNRCECAEGYRPDEKNKTCVGGVGSKCQYDSHCIENAFCRHQLVCFCKKEYWMVTEDNWRCRAEWESKAAKIENLFMIHVVLLITIIFIL